MSPDFYSELSILDKKKFWAANPLKGDIDIHLSFCQAFKMHSLNDDTVVKELYWTDFRGWEMRSLMLWKGLCEKVESGIILDIGSYSGIYSLIAGLSSKNSLIIAFDIQEKCVQRVQQNALLNGIGNIQTELKACSDENGDVVFYFYEEQGILSSVASIVPSSINDKSSMVQSVCLDDYLSFLETQAPVKLIKMDVEDAEVGTMRGLKSTLERSRPDILIEINSNKNLSIIQKELPKGYQVFSIDEKSPRLKKPGFFFKRFKGSRNFILSTKPLRKLEYIYEKFGTN